MCLAEGCKEEESVPVLRERTFVDSVAVSRDRPAARALRAESLRWLDIVDVVKRWQTLKILPILSRNVGLVSGANANTFRVRLR
jgi:hypothetical protein